MSEGQVKVCNWHSNIIRWISFDCMYIVH
jgi:hypothetical protein